MLISCNLFISHHSHLNFPRETLHDTMEGVFQDIPSNRVHGVDTCLILLYDII